MEIKIKRLHPEAKIPKKAYVGDAGFDLCAIEKISLLPGEQKQIRLGFSMEIPNGYVSLLFDKSGLSHKHNLKSFGGVIDSNYRGEYMTSIMNLGNKPYVFEVGDKVIQLLIIPVPEFNIVESETLSESPRNTGAFGSSGK